MRRFEAPEEKSEQKTKKVHRVCMPQWVHLPSFWVTILVILHAQFYSYEKGRKHSISEASKKLDRALPENILYIMYSLDLHPFLSGSFSVEQDFFSPFLISRSCGIFNRLHHFGVMFSWGGQLRCIIISCGKWWWYEGWGRRLLNHKNMFPIQKKMTVCRMFNFLLLCAHGECSMFKWGKSLVFTGACLVSFLLFWRLITLSEWFPGLLPLCSIYELR